jgi:hypothetical protein
LFYDNVGRMYGNWRIAHWSAFERKRSWPNWHTFPTFVWRDWTKEDNIRSWWPVCRKMRTRYLRKYKSNQDTCITWSLEGFLFSLSAEGYNGADDYDSSNTDSNIINWLKCRTAAIN